MLRYKRAAEHLVPRYENKICNADHALVLHESFAQPIVEHHSHSVDAPRSINEHPVGEPYGTYLPTGTDDHQYTFDVNDASVRLGFPSIGADLQPDSTIWPYIPDLNATLHAPMSSSNLEFSRAATVPRIPANEEPDLLPNPSSRSPNSRNILTAQKFRRQDTLKRSSQHRIRKLACPFYQDDVLHRRTHSCRSTHGGNMSDITRHINQRHKSQVGFLKLCPTCKEYFLDQREFEDFHGYNGEHCNTPRPYPRGGAVPAQWEALFKKLRPNAPRIPNPYHIENAPALPPQMSSLSSGTVTSEKTNQHSTSVTQDPPLFPPPNPKTFSPTLEPTQKRIYQDLYYSNSVQGSTLHEPLDDLLWQVHEFTKQSMARMKKFVPEDKQCSVRDIMVGEFSRHFDHLIPGPSEHSACRQSESIGESQPNYAEPCVHLANNTPLPSAIPDLEEQDSWGSSFPSFLNDTAHQPVQPNLPSDDHQAVESYDPSFPPHEATSGLTAVPFCKQVDGRSACKIVSYIFDRASQEHDTLLNRTLPISPTSNECSGNHEAVVNELQQHLTVFPSRAPTPDAPRVSELLGNHESSEKGLMGSPKDNQTLLCTPSFPRLSCDLCGQVFNGQYSNGNLARHKRLKHPTFAKLPELRCQACRKTYRRVDALKKHKWKKHNVGRKPEKRCGGSLLAVNEFKEA